MKKLSLIIAFCFVVCCSYAQQNNNISVHIENYHYNDVLYQTKATFRPNGTGVVPFVLPGISYARRVYKEIWIKANYSFWWNGGSGRGTINEHDDISYSSVGKIIARYKYQFADIEAMYGYSFYKTHKIAIEAGPSYTSGENDYLVDLSIYEPNGHVISSEYAFRNEHYWGAVFGLNYDFRVPKTGLNVGLDFKWRTYSGMPSSYNYGLHLGCYF